MLLEKKQRLSKSEKKKLKYQNKSGGPTYVRNKYFFYASLSAQLLDLTFLLTVVNPK